METAYLIHAPGISDKLKEQIISAIGKYGYLVKTSTGSPELNRDQIATCNAVFLYWPGISTSCAFEAGMAYAMKKQVYIIEAKTNIAGLSWYQKVIDEWSHLTRLIPSAVRIEIHE